VIELRGRWSERINLARERHQCGVCMNADSFKHRGEQYILIFRIAVLIGKNFGGRMWLVAIDAER
jgi:hypothetical protein